MKMQTWAVIALSAAGSVAIARPPVTVSLPASHDNTLFDYGTSAPDLSNGAGDSMFVGSTTTNGVRRGLVMFDLSSIPAGSTITSATLSLTCTRVKVRFASPATLYRVSASWGEAGSDSAGTGAGGAAQPGDATWTYRFYTDTSWTTPGGDFAAASSASIPVAQAGLYAWSGTGVTADVQSWVNAPATNFGWILLGEETTSGNVKVFATREYFDPAATPSLSITYTPPCVGDVNHDGVVNTLDLGTLLSHFGQSVPAGTLGDLNNDGVVNTLDLGTLLSHFGSSC